MPKGPLKKTIKKRKIARKKEKVREKKNDPWQGPIVYNDLPFAMNENGFCGNCRRPDNPLREIGTTSGKKYVHVCINCSRKMRPIYESASEYSKPWL